MPNVDTEPLAPNAPRDTSPIHRDASPVDRWERSSPSPIGSGGFGVVWHVRGRDATTVNEAALKVVDVPRLHRCAKVDNAQLDKDLRRELELLASLRHDSISCLIEAFIEPTGVVHMVMELCRGPTLQYLLDTRGAFSEDEARGVLLQLLEGVEYLHAQLVIHRDLKPQNIMCTQPLPPSWRDADALLGVDIKMVDFGFARTLAAAHGGAAASPSRHGRGHARRASSDGNGVSLFGAGGLLADAVSIQVDEVEPERPAGAAGPRGGLDGKWGGASSPQRLGGSGHNGAAFAHGDASAPQSPGGASSPQRMGGSGHGGAAFAHAAEARRGVNGGAKGAVLTAGEAWPLRDVDEAAGAEGGGDREAMDSEAEWCAEPGTPGTRLRQKLGSRLAQLSPAKGSKLAHPPSPAKGSRLAQPSPSTKGARTSSSPQRGGKSRDVELTPVGTRLYAAPELLQAVPAAQVVLPLHAALGLDIYSLGRIARFMLTGLPPDLTYMAHLEREGLLLPLLRRLACGCAGCGSGAARPPPRVVRDPACLSDGARAFIGLLQSRTPTERPSATAALCHEWLAAPRGGAEGQEHLAGCAAAAEAQASSSMAHADEV